MSHYLVTPELKEIWNHIDENMRDEAMSATLRDAGYTPGLHQTLTSVVLKGAPLEEAWHLHNILAPIQKFYQIRLEQTAQETDKAQGRYDALSRKVIPMTDEANEELETLLRRHSEEAFFHHNASFGIHEKLNLISFILADPILKQRDPGFDARGMSM